MSQISKCPRVTVVLSYWEASGEVSKLSYKSLLFDSSRRSYCSNHHQIDAVVKLFQSQYDITFMLLMISSLRNITFLHPQVLDIEDDNLRKKFIRDILTDSKSSREVINVSGFYQKPKLYRHSADLLISVLQSRVLLTTCLFQTFVEDLLERAKTL